MSEATANNIKKMYADAIIHLAKDKPLAKITINDLLKTSCTAKQTFYNHFRDKYDLINYIFRMYETRIIYSEEITWAEYLKKVLDFCLEQKKFFVAAAGMEGQNNFADFFVTHVVENFETRLCSICGNEPLTEELRFTIRFYAYGARGVFWQWIIDGMEESTEQLAKMIYQAMSDSLKTYIK